MIGNGTWGTCSWELDDNGNLTVYGGIGTGIKALESVPWRRYRQYIYTVQISHEVNLEDNTSLSYMFSNCENLQYADLSGLRTGNASAMNCMFQDCDNLISLDLSGFDTSNVISMSWMFRNCKKLAVLDLSGFNTSRVTGMSGLFSSCSSLKSIDLTSFDTSNVVSMISMFMNCSSLTTLDLSSFDTSKVTDMSWMFCNCTSLKTLNISNFDTCNVIDMSLMFSSCKNLLSINLTGFATYNVKSMQNMFLFCDSLKCLDLSTFETRGVEDMSDMFTGCGHLCSIVMGRRFSMTGNNGTRCEFPAQASEMVHDGKPWISAATGISYSSGQILDKVNDIYYIDGNDFMLSYIPNGASGDMSHCDTLAHSGYAVDIMEPDLTHPLGFAFKEWNTRRDGRGKSFFPGQTLDPIYSDVALYAIWASAPVMSRLEWPEAIVYGNKAPIKIPMVNDNNGDITSFGAEISPDGSDGWAPYDLDCIPSVELDGYYLRFYASNYMGTTYTDCVKLVIDKALYDMSNTRWFYNGSKVYDGNVKKVELTGLPRGVNAVYEGSEGITAGSYVASARLEYDIVNYQMPEPIEAYSWEILKATYDMSKIAWDCSRPFTYDGNEKIVSLKGLYGGLTAEYENNRALNAGVYTAKAILSYDTVNYEKPEEVEPCIWGIKKAVFDLGNGHWDYEEPFSYDGSVKCVYITDLPKGVAAAYEGNTATDAGVYETKVKFDIKDKDNFKVPDDSLLQWEIKKADYSMDGVSWEYNGPFVYDGAEKQVALIGLPEGVSATYFENCRTDAGEYEAHASLSVDDALNYNVPEMDCLQWGIGKAHYDMGGVRWSSEAELIYDGTEKSIVLEGLPEGVVPHYEGNIAILAGNYVASVSFEYDENNYYKPEVNDYSWTMDKAIYDMSTLQWINNEPLVYDGKLKTVYLNDLPTGVTAQYTGNTGTDAGIYTVSAILHMEDQDNYRDSKTPEFMWEIKKAVYDMSNVRWSYEESFVFDGEPKQVKLLNLPEGIEAVYSENSAVFAAAYIAMATFEYDENNYEMPSVAEFRWEIEKAEFKIDGARWSYEEPFTYDGEVKSISIHGLPEGIKAHYTGNEAVGVGIYEARATFEVEDNENYYPPEMEECTWLIQKAEINMDGIRWVAGDSLIFDGVEKEVYITGLPEGVSVAYENNNKTYAGEYEAIAEFTIEDEHNYETPRPIRYSWIIEKGLFEVGELLWASDEPLVYDGREKTVYIENLPVGILADYEGNGGIFAGAHIAKVTFEVLDKDNYYAPEAISHEWTIDKGSFDLKDIFWDYDENIYYSGTEKTVKLLGLPEGVSAEYYGEFGITAGNYKAEAVLHVEDSDNYYDPDTVSIYWEIKKGSYDMTHACWNYEEPFVYDGNEKSVELTGLPEGVRAKYTDNSSPLAGEYTASAEFISHDPENYNTPSGMSISWEIKKGIYDMRSVRWHQEEEFIYDGAEKSIYLTGLPEGVNAVYSGNREADAGIYVANAAISGDEDNYEIPEVDAFGWTIHRAWLDVSGIAWNYDEAFIYDETHKDILLEGIPDGVGVKYYNNRAVGAGKYEARAELILDPNSNYKAPELQICTWQIKQAEYDLNSLSWDYEGKFLYDGTEKSVKLTGLPGGVVPRYSGNTSTDAGEYTAEATFIYDEKNYHEPTVESCKWEIGKADHDMSGVMWNYQEPFVYDGTTKTVGLKPMERHVSGIKKLFKSSERISLTGLPTGVTASFEGNCAIDAGEYVARAVCEVDDPKNFRVPVIEDCVWTISKANYDMSGVYWIDDGTYTYDGKEKSARLSNIPDGVSVIYEDDKAIEAGGHISHARFKIDDEENYNVPESISFRWNIKKAKYDMSDVKWDYDSAFLYDEMEKSIHLQNLPSGVSAVYKGNSSIDAGVFIASADFEYDEANYEKPVAQSCKWRINRAYYDMSDVRWDYQAPFYYDGSEKAVVLTGLPDGVTAVYEHNRAIAVGIYTAKVTYCYDEKNYQKSEAVRSCRWEIKEAADTV
ncbi:MAG: BspA family leucine-rich repeat surface protein [Clostridiales bacterium]|nr:BspA family leucine-rich repeat surface protein [Clostridiales bacterium]